MKLSEELKRNPSIHSFNEYLLRVSCVPYIVLGSEDTTMNITNKNLALKKLTFYPSSSYVREANEMHDIREKNYNVSAAPTNMQ